MTNGRVKGQLRAAQGAASSGAVQTVRAKVADLPIRASSICLTSIAHSCSEKKFRCRMRSCLKTRYPHQQHVRESSYPDVRVLCFRHCTAGAMLRDLGRDAACACTRKRFWASAYCCSWLAPSTWSPHRHRRSFSLKTASDPSATVTWPRSAWRFLQAAATAAAQRVSCQLISTQLESLQDLGSSA